MLINSSTGLYKNNSSFSKRNANSDVATDKSALKTKNTEVPKNKSNDKLGLKIAVGTLATGFGVVAILKGVPLISKGKVNDFILSLDEKARKLKANANQSKTKKLSFMVLDKIKGAMNTYKVALNVTSIKDAGFKKITDKIPFVGKAFRKTTEISEKIATRMVEKKYAQTNKQFSKLYAALFDANATLNKADAQKYDALITNLRKNMNNSFSSSEVDLRLKNLKDSFDGIDAKVFSDTFGNAKSFLSSRGAYTNCLAEQISLPEKNKFYNLVNNLRANITNTEKNDINVIKQYISNINSVLDPLSNDTISTMKKVDSSLKNFSKNNSEDTRKALMESIKSLNNLVPDEKIKNELAKNIENFEFSKTGEIQNILSQYKEVLSKKEYAKLERAAENAMKSLNNATNMETNRLFEKMRDLEIGSAPTDVVSIASSIAAVGIGLGQAKSKDEKISAALNYGIPALGAVTVSSICTLSLVSAGPSLAIGLVSGLAMNKVGSLVDKIRKAMAKETQNPETQEVK